VEGEEGEYEGGEGDMRGRVVSIVTRSFICRKQSDDVPLSLLASLTPRPPAPDPQLTQDIDKGSPQSFVVSGRAEREAAEGEREHKRSHGVGGGE